MHATGAAAIEPLSPGVAFAQADGVGQDIGGRDVIGVAPGEHGREILRAADIEDARPWRKRQLPPHVRELGASPVADRQGQPLEAQHGLLANRPHAHADSGRPYSQWVNTADHVWFLCAEARLLLSGAHADVVEPVAIGLLLARAAVAAPGRAELKDIERKRTLHVG